MDCPTVYGPYTTVYNRFNRWNRRGRWQSIYEAWCKPDSTSIKVQRSAADGKGGRRSRQLAASAAGGRPRSTSSPTARAGITEAYRLAAQLPSNGCLIGDMGYDALELPSSWRSAAQPASFPATRLANIHG
jgi:transposase